MLASDACVPPTPAAALHRPPLIRPPPPRLVFLLAARPLRPLAMGNRQIAQRPRQQRQHARLGLRILPRQRPRQRRARSAAARSAWRAPAPARPDRAPSSRAARPAASPSSPDTPLLPLRLRQVARHRGAPPPPALLADVIIEPVRTLTPQSRASSRTGTTPPSYSARACSRQRRQRRIVSEGLSAEARSAQADRGWRPPPASTPHPHPPPRYSAASHRRASNGRGATARHRPAIRAGRRAEARRAKACGHDGHGVVEDAGSVAEERADGKDLILRHRLALARATSRVCSHLEAKGKRAEALTTPHPISTALILT